MAEMEPTWWHHGFWLWRVSCSDPRDISAAILYSCLHVCLWNAGPAFCQFYLSVSSHLSPPTHTHSLWQCLWQLSGDMNAGIMVSVTRKKEPKWKLSEKYPWSLFWQRTWKWWKGGERKTRGQWVAFWPWMSPLSAGDNAAIKIISL